MEAENDTYQVDHTIKVLQTFLLEHPGVHVIFKVTVVDLHSVPIRFTDPDRKTHRQTQAVEAQRSEQLGILFLEKVLEELRVSAMVHS